MFINILQYKHRQSVDIHNILIDQGLTTIGRQIWYNDTNAFTTLMSIYHNNKSLQHEVSIKDLIEGLTNYVEVSITDDRRYPEYNLYHHGNNCYINAVFSMLSGCTYLLRDLIDYIQNNDSTFIQNIIMILISTYSPISPFIHLPNDVATRLGYDYRTAGSSEEFMKHLYKHINDEVKLDWLYWDTSDMFIPKDLHDKSFNEVIATIKPKYLFINVGDYNTIHNINSNMLTVDSIVINDDIEYSCLSVVLHIGVHFMLATYCEDGFVINNDLDQRDDIKYSEHINFGNHYLACFVLEV